MSKRLIIFVIFFITSSQGFAHEAWILTPEQIDKLSHTPPPLIFSNLSILTLILSFTLGLGLFLAILIDHIHLKKINRIIDYILIPIADDYGPMITRLFLGFMLFCASLGTLPRFGMDAMGHATLLVPDMDLRLLGKTGTEWLFIKNIQLLIGMMLILGLFIRHAVVMLFVLMIFGVYSFGMGMMDYFPHFFVPCLYLFHKGGGKYFILHHSDASLKSTTVLKWEHIYPIMLFVTGITFSYLGYSKKVLNPNLIIVILENFKFPNFGIPYDILAFIMAMIEVCAGILIACGLLVRPLCLFLLIAISTFTILLNEPLLFHGNIIAVMIILFLWGNGKPIYNH